MAGDGDVALVRPRLDGFRSFILLHGAVRSWLWLRYNEHLGPEALLLSAAGLSVCFALTLVPRFAHVAARAALPFLALQLFLTFPLTDNHFMLELLCVVLLALIGGNDGATDRALTLASLRWLAAIVLFHTGLQKVLYGHYFGGEFLAFMVAVGDRFADIFQPFIPAGEIARLESYDPMQTGAGPFRVSYLPLVAVSNAVYLAELVLPALLIWQRTRTLALIATTAFLLAIQLGARELGFALLFVNLLLLFSPVELNRRLLPLFAAIYLYGLAAALGVAPGGGWLEPGYL